NAARRLLSKAADGRGMIGGRVLTAPQAVRIPPGTVVAGGGLGTNRPTGGGLGTNRPTGGGLGTNRPTGGGLRTNCPTRGRLGQTALPGRQSFTFTEEIFQIRSQYSRIARSEEKYPIRATFRMDILAQLA